MARRLVRAVRRDRDGTITALCDPGESWSPRLSADAIADIVGRRHSYLASADGAESPIEVVRGPTGPYLRSSANADAEDNLDNLPLEGELPRRARVPVRRNAAFLPAAERRRFVAAVLELHRRFLAVDDAVDPVSMWFKQDQIHQATHVHDEVTFLPWHRELCNRFEQLLQEVDPGLALHYWDWTTDPRRDLGLPGLPPLLDDGGFLGSSNGPVGAPFTELYDPDAALHRDLPSNFGVTPEQRAAMPPQSLSRELPASGRAPTEVRLDDFDFSDLQRRPTEDSEVRVRPDRDLVDEGSGGDADTRFERFWRAVNLTHGWAHAYLGGDIGREPGTTSSRHTSFRDPFVFLLHSNLDRLWASWQLRREGDSREVSPRIDPGRMYGGLLEGRVGLPDDPGNSEQEGRDAVRELTATMPPWNGRGGIFPWRVAGQEQPRTPVDPAVVRPPLYDRYTHDDELTAAWATLLLGRRLADGDEVRAVIDLDVHDPGSVELVLHTAREVRWWKGLRVPSPDGVGTVLLETRDHEHRAAVTVPTDVLHAAGPLVFHKEQASWVFWRVKRICYRLADLGRLPGGCRVVFRWERD